MTLRIIGVLSTVVGVGVGGCRQPARRSIINAVRIMLRQIIALLLVDENTHFPRLFSHYIRPGAAVSGKSHATL
jgi:hypothetical protein